MLPARDGLGPGLGLGAFRLLLLPTPWSIDPDVLLAEPAVNMLFGLVVVLLGFRAAGAGFGFGLGCSMMVTAVGRTNMPLPMAQSK